MTINSKFNHHLRLNLLYRDTRDTVNKARSASTNLYVPAVTSPL